MVWGWHLGLPTVYFASEEEELMLVWHCPGAERPEGIELHAVAWGWHLALPTNTSHSKKRSSCWSDIVPAPGGRSPPPTAVQYMPCIAVSLHFWSLLPLSVAAGAPLLLGVVRGWGLMVIWVVSGVA